MAAARSSLVCTMLYESQVVICNPLTGDFKMVAIIDKEREYKENKFFGFCLNGDKGYEVFKVFYEVLPDGKLVLVAEAYSLSTSSWRKLDTKKGDFDHLKDHPRPREPYQTMPVFIRGVFYWAVADFDTAFVLSLDVENEIFDEVLASSCERWTLFDLNEEVGLVEYHDDLSFVIWVLDEKDKSWVMKFEMEEDYEINDFIDETVRVVGSVGSDELLVGNDDGEGTNMYLYDMDRDDVEELPYVNFDDIDEVYIFTESLVSVNVGHDQ